MTEGRLKDPEIEARLLGREPIGRIVDPQEVVAAVVWLCSDARSFVTGHALAEDGWTAQIYD